MTLALASMLREMNRIAESGTPKTLLLQETAAYVEVEALDTTPVLRPLVSRTKTTKFLASEES